jgi:hypothetical protein
MMRGFAPYVAKGRLECERKNGLEGKNCGNEVYEYGYRNMY